MTGKPLCLSAALLAVLCFAPVSRAQQQPESPGLDPSWTDEPEPQAERPGPEAESAPVPSASAPPDNAAGPPALPPPGPWVASDPWFRVELYGDDRQSRFKIYSLAKGADKKVPIHGCASPCRVLLPRGEYRVHVSGDAERIEGDRRIELTADTSLRFSLPDRSARTTGLVLGITGSALVGVGMLVLLFSNYGADQRDGGQETRTGAYVGAGMLITGAVLTPIGWVQFGRNRKPSVERHPLGGEPQAAVAPRLRVAAAPVAGGAAAGVSVSF
jgi:hypothetical protein